MHQITTAAPPAARSLDHPDRPGRRRPLVLAVEDAEHDWLIYGKLLWYNGFDVVHAKDGEEGLRLAREEAPDVVLADLMLPGMSGIEMCQAIKRDPAIGHIPVVMLTARSRREFGVPAREAGCDLFLEKPIGPVQVLHTIEGLVGRAPPAA